jgi:hypothetical protein
LASNISKASREQRVKDQEAEERKFLEKATKDEDIVGMSDV